MSPAGSRAVAIKVNGDKGMRGDEGEKSGSQNEALTRAISDTITKMHGVVGGLSTALLVNFSKERADDRRIVSFPHPPPSP
jgi:hypothetical protein